MPDLALDFVNHPYHRQVLKRECRRAERSGALGLLLCGSVARGTASAASDLDLVLLWPEPHPFESEICVGTQVERHGETLERAAARLEGYDATLYGWAEGRILLDPDGRLAALQDCARALLTRYRTPQPLKRSLHRWLSSTLAKLDASSDPGYQGFLVATTTWKLMEALCAVGDRPVPASTRLWELLPSLSEQPEGWQADLFAGDSSARVASFRDVAAWVLPRLV